VLVGDALRLVQSRNPADQFAVWEIDNSNGIIAQFGNEQALPLQINRHVVDPATDVAKRNLGFELQRSRVQGLGRRLACGVSQRYDAG